MYLPSQDKRRSVYLSSDVLRSSNAFRMLFTTWQSPKDTSLNVQTVDDSGNRPTSRTGRADCFAEFPGTLEWPGCTRSWSDDKSEKYFESLESRRTRSVRQQLLKWLRLVRALAIDANPLNRVQKPNGENLRVGWLSKLILKRKLADRQLFACFQAANQTILIDIYYCSKSRNHECFCLHLHHSSVLKEPQSSPKAKRAVIQTKTQLFGIT